MDPALYFHPFEGPSFIVNCRLMLILHLGYESIAVVYGRSSLEVMDFGNTCIYVLRMCGPVTTAVVNKVLYKLRYCSINMKLNLFIFTANKNNVCNGR